MAVNHLHIDRILSSPTENNAPLVTDPQAPELCPFTFYSVEIVYRYTAQAAHDFGCKPRLDTISRDFSPQSKKRPYLMGQWD